MSRDWNEKELQMASDEMKKMGYMSYEEFCEYLKKHPMTGIRKDERNEYNVLKIM